MTPKPKTPTASGISRLLAAAGFKRSERQIGGYGSGFVAETRDAVRVWHRFWSMGGGDAAPWLAKYAEAITAEGWTVRTENDAFGRPVLIVTAKPEDSSLLAAKDPTPEKG